MKPSFKYSFIAILAFVVLLLPTASFSETKKIAVLPWKINSAQKLDYLGSAMVDMLVSRVGSAREMEVTRPDVIKDALKDYEEITDSTASDLGARLALDYVLYGSLTVVGESLSLDANLLDVKEARVSTFYKQGTGLDSVIGMADGLSSEIIASFEPGPAPVPVEIKPAPAPLATPAPVPAPPVVEEAPGVRPAVKAPEKEKEEFIIKSDKEDKEVEKSDFWTSDRIDGLFLAMTAADLDGDGAKELFLVRSTGIVIADIKDRNLKVKKEIKTGTSVDIVSVDSVDSDNNGKPEVYVSGVRNGRAYGYVVEFMEGDYRITLEGIRWLLRSIEMEGKGHLLAGQGFRLPDAFHGEVRVFKKGDSEMVDNGPLGVELPTGLDLYRFEVFNFNSKERGEKNLVALDDRGYLRVYRKNAEDGWDRTWKSRDYYGGTLNYIGFDEGPTVGDGPELVAVEGSFVYTDLDGDGANEVIVKVNAPGGVLGRYARIVRAVSSGSVVSLSWDGQFLKENWRTKGVDGYISDFILEDLDGDGAVELVMLVTEGMGMLSPNPKSYILSYKLKP